MKLLILLGVLASCWHQASYLSIDSRRPNLSFLKFIGSLSANDSTRNFYLSQQIEYTWIAANSFCKLNGMKLAVLPKDKAELRDFVSKVFAETNFQLISADSQPLNGITECRLFNKKTEEYYNFIHADCSILNLTKGVFLCEYEVEEMASLTNLQTQQTTKPNMSDDSTASEKFFDLVGEVTNDNREVIKKYFMSNEVQGSPADAIKYCQSMDMILASPQSQLEFDQLKQLLRKVTFKWSNAAIAGYLSNGTWLESNDKLNYEINWGPGEPNNAKNNEACIFMQPSANVSVNDDPCNTYNFPYGSFICELDVSRGVPKVIEIEDEYLRFLEKFAVIAGLKKNGLTVDKELFVSHDGIKLKWIDAVLLCKSLGMEIFVPETMTQLEVINATLSNVSDIKSFYTGLVKVGGGNKWYSINDGKNSEIKELFDMADENFLGIRKSGEFLYFGVSEHEPGFDSVICQKFVVSSQPINHLTQEETPHVSENEIF